MLGSGWLAWAWQSSKSQVARRKPQLGPGHAALPLPTLLPSPPPPSTLLARPRRLTDSAADRPGPFHLAAGCWPYSVQHEVTESPRAKEADSLTGPAWYGLPCTKLGANLSHSSYFACSATLQPPICCSALLCSVPTLSYPVPSYPHVHTGLVVASVVWARLPVCLPSPRPFLNYTLHCARHLVGSCRQNTTQPNPTHLSTQARTRTLLLPTWAPTYLAYLDPKVDLQCVPFEGRGTH